MKVYLGPFNTWFQPREWIFDLCSLFANEEQKAWLVKKLFRNYDDDGIERWWWAKLLQRMENWLDSHTKRKIKIRIDYYDSWNAEHTLALIAAPLIKQLAAKKHGAPFTDDEDAPEHLRSNAPPSCEDMESNGDLDANHFARWEWILGEMIFAMDSIVDDSWEEQFRDPFDRQGHLAYSERILNGCRLFGKYFQALWD